MEKRTVFKSTWLPVLFALPQFLLILLFFYWPVAAVLNWAFTLEPPFGGQAEFVGLANFVETFGDPLYWQSILTSLIFAIAGPFFAILIGLVLALAVDRQLPGSGFSGCFISCPMRLPVPPPAWPSASSCRRNAVSPHR